MQQAVLTLSDEVAAALQNIPGESLEQRILELSAIQAHERDLLTEREVMKMLGGEHRKRNLHQTCR